MLLNYCSIINLNIKELFFLYKGKFISLDKKEKIKEFKNNNIIISVFKKKSNKNNNKEKINYIICPKCKQSMNLVLFNFDDEKIILDKCINNHKTLFYNLKDFFKSQIINIKCEICKNDANFYNNILYYDSNKLCVCSLCKTNGNNIINIHDKFLKCIKHNKNFISYCKDCNNNLCNICEIAHSAHKITFLKQIKIKENKLKKLKII